MKKEFVAGNYVIPEIKQITPCMQNMYAVFKDCATGGEFTKKVVAFALCNDGCVYPQLFNGELGIDSYSQNDVIRYELGEDRIATALEDMNDKMTLLSNSVGYYPPRPHMKEGFHFLRICGQVDTD